MKGVDKVELVYSETVTVETVKGYDGLRSECSVEVQELATFLERFESRVRVFDKCGAREMSSLAHYDVLSISPLGCSEQLVRHLPLVLFTDGQLDQLSLLRTLVTEDPKRINAVDAVIWPRYHAQSLST